MPVPTQITAILNKKMDRQDFIKHVAIGMVALSGVGTALRFMAPKRTQAANQNSYGGSAYGGVNTQK
jgi:hypothetical protein